MEYLCLHQTSLVRIGLLRYEGLVRTARPGIARTDRRRAGSFASLLDQVLEDDGALDGLVFAYSGLSGAERRAFIQAVVQDAEDPTEPLLALLAVEEAPPLQQRLASLVAERTHIERSAFLREAGGRGEALLAQTLGSQAPEALRVIWEGHEIISIELVSLDDSSFETLPSAELSEAVDRLTPMLWGHIRSGASLPSELARFAGFFSLS